MKILEENQKNIISLLLSVLGIGILISMVANIVFTEFYESNKGWFICVCSASIIIIIFFFIHISYRLDRMIYKIEFPLIFDNHQKRFVDLPYSPTSVNARVLFDDLPSKQKDMIIENKELFRFANSFVVQYIFSRIFSHSSWNTNIDKWIPLDREYLKDILVNYKYVDLDTIVGERNRDKTVMLPKGFKIKSVNDNEILLSTKQGFVKFSWNIILHSPCQDKLFFLAQLHEKDISGYSEFSVQLTLEYSYKPLKLFFNSTKNFDNYMERCIEELNDSDIGTVLEKTKMIYMTEVIKKLEINTYKESLPVKIRATEKHR